jgi:hypothetical protein
MTVMLNAIIGSRGLRIRQTFYKTFRQSRYANSCAKKARVARGM